MVSPSPSAVAHAVHHAPLTFSASLNWTVPLILIIPLVAFVVIAFSVRSRRAAATVNLLGSLLTLLAAVLAAAARAQARAPYVRAFQWINIPTATTGPAQFQGFGIDINLTIDHAGMAVLVGVTLVSLAVGIWARRGARSEPGPVRSYALLSLLTFAAAGVCVSGDLGELTLFWVLAGAATYLLLTQRWRDPSSTAPVRWTVVMPVAADVALVLAVGLIYSRYGQLTLSHLPAALGHTKGAGLKSLTAAAILLILAAAGRGALFPFQSWLTATRETPSVSQAMAQGIWPLLGVIVLYRGLFLIHHAGPQALLALQVAGAAAAILLPLRALVGNDIRLVLTGAGIGQAGLVFLMLARGDGGLAVTAALAGGLARAGAILAAAGLSQQMHSVDLGEMAGGLGRTTLSAVALALFAITLAISGDQAGALGLHSAAWSFVYGVGLLLLAGSAARACIEAGLGRLRRRRGFDPDRVREVQPSMVLSALVVAVLALVAGVLTFSTRWLHFLVGGAHFHPSSSAALLWLAIPAAGMVLSGLAYGWKRSGAEKASGGAGRSLERAGVTLLVPAAYLASLVGGLPERAEASLAQAGDGTVWKSVRPGPRVQALGLAALPALVGLAVIAAVIASAVAPGWVR